MPARHRIAAILAAALALGGLSACDAEESTSTATARTLPPVREASELAERANILLDGGPTAFKEQLTALRGTPIVVNQWASWCGPCRFEFPFFRDQARKYDGRVAFLGVNSKDSPQDAGEFLEKMPVPFPHYYDQDATVARVFKGGRSWPTTAFYDASGELVFTHQGQYRSGEDLEADITRYALRD
jgi:cytochrome c biogenesis protein CcmG/thiol:disulfide interchange protein DsbE